MLNINCLQLQLVCKTDFVEGEVELLEVCGYSPSLGSSSKIRGSGQFMGSVQILICVNTG